MSKVNTIARLDPRIVYTGAAWTNLGTAAQNPVAGGVTSATNATNGRGQFGVGSGALNGYSIMKGTGAGITPMVSGVDFTYDSRLDALGGSNVDVYDDNTAGNLDSGKYFRIVEGAGNIASSIYPKSPGTPSYGLQIVAKDLTTEVSPPKTQCYVDPVKGKFVLPRPIYWSKMESLANATTGAEIGSATCATAIIEQAIKFGNGLVQVNTNYADFFNIANSVLSSGTISFWSYTNISTNAFHRIYIDDASTTWLSLGSPNGNSIIVNNVEVATSAAWGSGTFHIYIVWDYNKGLSGGKSIRVFKNGVENLSTTVTLPTFTSNIIFRAYIWNSWLGWDNVKIWNHVVTEDPAFEYNSGTGRESALHYIYGSANNYAPAITGAGNGVCYDWTSLPTDPVKLIKGSDQTVTLENASNISVGSGTFGSPSNLSTSAFVQLTAGTQFQYDKRLDASTTEDATNGFGATAGGIIDTGVSGSLSSGKYIRIVEDGAVSGTKNIKDAAGLNLQVYAKQIVNPATLFPPVTQCYVDPANGKFVLPKPTYWSKCESIAGIETGEIGTARYTTYYAPGFGFPAGKFGNCVSMSTNPQDSFSIYVAESVSLTSATISLWAYWTTATGNSYQVAKFGNLWVMFGEYKGISLNGGGSWETVIASNSLAEGNWYHAYILVDSTKGLSGGKSVRMFMNGTEKASSTSSLSSLTNVVLTMGCLQPPKTAMTYFDNIKYFNHVVSENSAWEYNSGTGRESALHYIYGATNNYVPKLIAPGGVGYYKAGSSGNYATMTF